ncbi:MAG: lamin tail domain-containing protein [Candidatus Limnocylindrales bacterium]
MRRPRPDARAALALVASFVAGGCTAVVAASPPVSPPSLDGSWAVSDVIDGDTIRVTAPGAEETVRLIGINTPENGECWADEATAALTQLLGTEPVRMERDVSERDPFGRLLRYVITPEGEDAGGLLVDGGHALARAYPPDTSHDVEYRARQRLAQEAGLGLWARDACGPALPSIDPASIHIDVHPDAAGDDSRNLNDEWVRITNQGDADLDLDGWTVRDESSSHRYHFEGLVLPPGASVTLRSGCGLDTDAERHWCVSGSAIWNNGGDTVLLLDPLGNIVAQLGYP